MKILFKNARILTMESPEVINGSLVVLNNRIAYIGDNYQSFAPFDREIDCHQNLLMPGFKNAHAHSAMVFLRDKARNVNLQTWLFDVVFPREAHLIPEDIYHLNKVAYLEYVSGGITACFEHYFFPFESARSAEDFGMRTLLLGTYDKEKTSVAKLVDNYHYYNDKKNSLVRYMIGFHAEYTADLEMIKKTKEALDLVKGPFFTHISETQREVKECYERYQMTPAKFLYEQGLFAYGGGGYHCIHFTDEETKIFKDHHLSVVSCPGSNDYLSSGIAPLSKYLKEGINVALGTDGPASNDSLDMFKEMRLAATREKEKIPAFEILKMATVNAAKAMYLDEADVLAVNKYADLIMIDLSKINDDIINNLVYKAEKKDVLLTMINGQILYENGEFFLKESVDNIYQEAHKVEERIEKEVEK